MLHLCTYYGRAEMVETIIKDNRGFLLINSIDKNNDSPAHLAAFRKQIPILVNLAKNNAFLDQPNAESKDPIMTIQDEKLRLEVINKLKKLDLDEKTQKHLKNLEKRMEKKATTPIKTNESKTSIVLKKEESVNGIELQQLEKMEELKVKKGLAYFNDIITGKTENIEKEARKKMKLEEKNNYDDFKENNDDFKFDLPFPSQEMELSDTKVVSCLVPGRGFFYLPKTTAFDREWALNENPNHNNVNLSLSNTIASPVEERSEKEIYLRKQPTFQIGDNRSDSDTQDDENIGEVNMVPVGSVVMNKREESDRDFNRTILNGGKGDMYERYYMEPMKAKVPSLSLAAGQANPFY